jgi:hypothetical protein
MRNPLTIAISLFLFSLLSCGDQPTGLDVPSATGTWRSENNSSTLRLDLTETSTKTITGSGRASADGAVVDIDVLEGFHDHPSIRLTLAFGGAQITAYQGTFSGANDFTVQDTAMQGPVAHFRRE